VQGQGELATESLNDIPENHITSKTEYTNAQQGSRFLLLKNNKEYVLISIF
jgi:hypothetical protein